MNKVNLRLLADWLITNADRLTHTQAFSMEYYRSDSEGEKLPSWEGHSCGTVGCAIGWGPSSGISELKATKDHHDLISLVTEGHVFNWDTYSEDVMGLDSHSSGDDELWDWCFDEDWKDYDNTPEGAGIRILYLLAHEDDLEWDLLFDYEAVALYMNWYKDQPKI